jgi:serine/threonine protein kinase/Tfp pilus assembly protein PilF
MGLPAGTYIGPYEVLALLGAGGMGEVYRARDSKLNREIALKVLPEQVAADPERLARFTREAQTLAALNHPNIAHIYGLEESADVRALVMELVEGEDLAQRMRRGTIPVGEALVIGRQIAAALEAAHGRGIIHRDLKPANVMLGPGGVVKVLDFGLATRMENPEAATAQTQEAMTQPGALLGTPAYMAPEALVGKPADARGDIWALGVILYEMATGALPFTGPTPVEFASAILKETPAPLPQHVPLSLRTIVQRCLTKEPEHRYRAAGEVRGALDAAASGSLDGPQPRRPRVPGKHAAWAVAVLVAALIATVVWQRAELTNPTGALIQSLAVLPLENLSADPEQEYFADGMTDQLIADLSKIETLRVISRTSVMQYKRARKPLSTIARELNVDAVVEGSVVRTGDRIRVSARLLRGGTEKNLWAGSYERDVRDTLALQTEVARSIARDVDITLTPQTEARLTNARRVNPAAQELYLLGRFHANKQTEEGLKRAIEYFERAVAQDPSAAPAYVGLAEAYARVSSNYVRPREAMPKAKAAALAALKLDGSLADAHAALGFIHLIYDWDGPAARRALQRAIQLNPSLGTARLNYASYLSTQGRHDEVVQEIRQAVALDPLSLRVYAEGTALLLFARRYDDALQLTAKGLALEPNFAFGLALQGVAYAEQRRFPEAIRSLQKAAAIDRSPTILAFAAHVHAVAGEKAQAVKLMEEVERIAEQRYFCPYEIGTSYVSVGDADAAVRWFEKGVEERADCMAWLGVEPWIDPFRSDPRYAELLRKVGLAPPTKATSPQ